MSKRLQQLPPSVKRLPFAERQLALQQIVNSRLHRQNICPIAEYVAGPRAPRVGVYYDAKNRYWYLSAADGNEEHLEANAMEAIESQREQDDRIARLSAFATKGEPPNEKG